MTQASANGGSCLEPTRLDKMFQHKQGPTDSKSIKPVHTHALYAAQKTMNASRPFWCGNDKHAAFATQREYLAHRDQHCAVKAPVTEQAQATKDGDAAKLDKAIASTASSIRVEPKNPKRKKWAQPPAAADKKEEDLDQQRVRLWKKWLDVAQRVVKAAPTAGSSSTVKETDAWINDRSTVVLARDVFLEIDDDISSRALFTIMTEEWSEIHASSGAK